MTKAVYLALFLCPCGAVPQTSPTTVDQTLQRATVMTVGGRAITVSELCTALESLPPPQRTGFALHPKLAKDWFGPLVAMAEEAKREHLAIDAKEKLNDVDRENGLVGELIQAIARDIRPSDADIEKYYSTHTSDFEEATVRHILISDATALGSRSKRSPSEARAKAQRIAAELKSGADFAALATKESDDRNTKNEGGNLGRVSHHQLEPAVDQFVWSLKPGESSAPFEGRFGYEIVRVEERRLQPLATVREVIIGKIKAAALDRKQQEIVADAHIWLDPAYADGPLPCAAPGPPFSLKDPSPVR